jgi:hypothetical protein
MLTRRRGGCFDSKGRPRFYELMFGRGDRAFVAFDVLALGGRDLRELPPIEGIVAKRKLRREQKHCASADARARASDSQRSER